VRRTLIILLSVVFLVTLLAYTATFSVRFTESAVLTTFGRATADDIKRDAGLYFKWPYPIQSVTTYDTRARVAQGRLEQQQTADDQAITVESFATWRVADPLKFFQRFSNTGMRSGEHFAAAKQVIEANLRASSALVSRYKMNDLFNAAPGASKLPELESKMLLTLQMKDSSNSSLADYGIEVTSVGISRIVLPESVTTAVFEAMKQRRLTLAKETESRGEAEAASIREDGAKHASRIRTFADERAKELMTLGDLESAPFLRQMGQHTELAVFLQNMAFVRTAMAKRATLVLSSSMPGISVFFPDALAHTSKDGIPSMTRAAPAPASTSNAAGAGGGQ
jgi:modulator of FtsH protease HflC